MAVGGEAASLTVRQAIYAQSRRTRDDLTSRLPHFANHDYNNWRLIWLAIRHAMIGEVEIKRYAGAYLPRLEGMTDDDYHAFLDRAVFYNMVYRTVTGLTGAIFRREPRFINAGPKLLKISECISRDRLSLKMFAKVISQEMLSVGRYGVLVDKPASDSLSSQPYLAGYSCENILDWTTTVIDGREEINYVLLREFQVDRRLFIFEGKSTKPLENRHYGQLYMSYRILRLQWNEEDGGKWEYVQELYSRDGADADLTEEPEVYRPMVYGKPMERIPFRFFNATTGRPDIEKPPILDILTLNLSHYKSYALLEHGRFYTANPVYYVTGATEDAAYRIGPSVVWEIGQDQKAGLIEYNGLGLKSLENALAQKETQVASLGGRLIGDSSTAGQSDNQIKLKDRNEQSLLLNVTTVLNENFTDLLRILGQWLNEPQDENMEFRVNQDFLVDAAAAREFRAVTMMYQAGLLPIEVIYEYFLKADVIPEYITREMFVKMLDDAKQFPNDPDFESRREGFPNASQQRDDELQRFLDHSTTARQDDAQQHETGENELDRTLEETKIKTQAETQQHSATEAGKTARHAATQAAKNGGQPGNDIPPVPAQASQAGSRDAPTGKPAAKPARKAPPKG